MMENFSDMVLLFCVRIPGMYNSSDFADNSSTLAVHCGIVRRTIEI